MTPALADFAGVWTVTRVIEDRRAGRTGRFHGTATFTPDGAGLSYREEGVLEFGDAGGIRAERRCLWREAGQRIAILFADGRPFHSFGEGRTEAAHWCDPDNYRVTYDFSRWPEWSAAWEVTGPRKDYRMVTFYARADGGPLRLTVGRPSVTNCEAASRGLGHGD